MYIDRKDLWKFAICFVIVVILAPASLYLLLSLFVPKSYLTIIWMATCPFVGVALGYSNILKKLNLIPKLHKEP